MKYRCLILFVMMLGLGGIKAKGYGYPKPRIRFETLDSLRTDNTEQQPISAADKISNQGDHHHQHSKRIQSRHHFQEQVTILGDKVKSETPQQPPVNKVDTESNNIKLAQFLNRDNEFIYRLATKSNRSSSTPKASRHKTVTHLNLHLAKKHKSEVKDFSGRRLTPYTETINENEYFQ